MERKLKFDEIGYWSEIKLDIIREYASAYSKILCGQKSPKLYQVYIDAFAGAGIHVSKATGGFVPGSPVNALSVYPPFKEYHFIDLDELKIDSLENIAGTREDVFTYHGDCNSILHEKVFLRAKYKDYKRALCILDPYGLHLNWEVLCEAGQMGSIDIFLNFPVADINRNVLWKNPDGVSRRQIERMNIFWGDASWRNIAYTESPQMQLFGDSSEEKASNEVIAEAYRKRLKNFAGFKNVPKPIAMRNTQNAVVYYLFFASQKPIAGSIVKDIFKKYSERNG
jgi:three-Cys-motif partner protein